MSTGRYLRLLVELLRDSWRLRRLVTSGVVVAAVASVAMTPLLALALRAAVDGIARGARDLLSGGVRGRPRVGLL